MEHKFRLRAALATIIIAGLVIAYLTKSFRIQPSRGAFAMSQYEGKVAAPEFPIGLDWLNTNRPLSLKEMRGKLVLLDFWTYCCINCMHIIPDLKKLEKKYSQELVVIGVHSAKFTTEQETENIRQAILRYEIEHPVINDRDMLIWRRYGVNAWPTLFLIDPLGKVIGYLSGEGVYEPFDELISKVIEVFDAKGLMNRQPLRLDLEKHHAPHVMLSFPGKVLADERSKQLFIADSNNNRIVIVSIPDGAIKEVIGSGQIGFMDGDFARSSFYHPQGMAFDGKGLLYVADTENHAIRLVNLEKKIVKTIAGTGERAREHNISGVGVKVSLNSPWDLVLHDNTLYIAMAGSHQLWKMNLKTFEIRPYAGSGREGRIDGPLLQAALAQPSGITTDGKKLYFADSEVSAIRTAALDPGGKVETIVGVDLFEFGDRDGMGNQVRLQHPLGIAYYDGILYVTDTYNNKIKKIDRMAQRADTFAGTGRAGLRDGKSAMFDEPGGLSIAGGKIYIADTNNHIIRIVDLETGLVSTLELKGLEKLEPSIASGTPGWAGETIHLPTKYIAPGHHELAIELVLPDGFKLNSQAPSRVIATSKDHKVVRFTGGVAEQALKLLQFPLIVPTDWNIGSTHLELIMYLYYCPQNQEGLCFFKNVKLVVPVQVGLTNIPPLPTIKISYALKQ